MNRQVRWWLMLGFGWLLMACAPSASAQRPDQPMEMEPQGQMAESDCGCPAGEDGACPMHGEGGCPMGCGCGSEGSAHACPMGKSCPMHRLPEGTRAIVEETELGAVVRLEAPSNDEAAVEATRQAARRFATMVEEGCPMMKKGQNSPHH